FVFVASVFLNSTALAQDWKPIQTVDSSVNQKLFKLYKSYAEVPAQNIITPTVEEADFSTSQVYGNSFGIFDKTLQKFIPYFLVSNNQTDYSNVTAKDNNLEKMDMLFDGKYSTMHDFYLTNQDKSSVQISVDFGKDIKSNSLNLVLDNYV